MPERDANLPEVTAAGLDAATMRALLDQAPLGVLVTEGQGAEERIVAASARGAALLGRPVEWLSGRAPGGLLHEGRGTSAVGTPASLVRGDGSVCDCASWRVPLGAGRTAIYLLPAADAATPAGGTPADPDRLAGFSTPEVLREVLAHDWAVGQRDGRSVSILQFDVDAAQGYREVFGRQAVESVVRQVGRTIAATLRRTSDVVARTGDDDFTALCVAMRPEHALAHAETMLERIRALSLHHPRARSGRIVTCSAGVVTVVPPRGLPFESLVAAASEALALAKSGGGNRVVAGTLAVPAEPPR